MYKLTNLWEGLRSSLWFVPTLIVAGAVALAVVLIEIDAADYDWKLADRFPRLFGAGAEGSRGLLAAIAGSMITVAGTTFSITIVALAQASSQYTSRILRNFMSDRASQSVLGVFVGVFAYCLVVLRTIRGGDDGLFVPSLAVVGAVLLAFVAIGFLIFFIHHIAASIQASSIIAAAAEETLAAVDRLFPDEVGDAVDPASSAQRSEPTATWIPIPARKTGYIQSIDADALFDLAREVDAVVRMERGVGEFVIENAPLAAVSGVPCEEDVIEKLNDAYTVGRHRTVHQDAAYGIRQIVDVALKALSPGINDTTTAVNCIDYLGAILARLAARSIEAPYRADDARLRLITRGPTFPGLLCEAFGQIRQNAQGNVAVLARLLAVMEIIAGRTSDAQRRQALDEQTKFVTEAVERSVPCAADRASIRAGTDRFATSMEQSRYR
ncbi:MAG TPA: DUF2254 domain-containing protein [Tepidisphaeraceae bacterium]|nr:DUF2254 domain-containing protein [Tepidisphaeraceae bacterium]